MEENDSRGILLFEDSTEDYTVAQYIPRRGDGSPYHAL
jgi:hypothetical protein